MENYSNHRVKHQDLSMTSKSSHNGYNKFRVKGKITQIYIEKHYSSVRPAKPVVPIATSFEYNIKIHTFTLHFRVTQPSSHTSSWPDIRETHQVKVKHTHRPTMKVNIKDTQRKQKTTQNWHIMTNITSRNGCRVTQIRTQNERISYILELEKRYN